MKRLQTSIVFFFVAFGLVVATSCKRLSQPAPLSHRPIAEVCPSAPRPPGYGSGRDSGHGSGGTMCDGDADCTAGKNGRCQIRGHGTPQCTYDQCMQDSECPAGKVCECSSSGNTCLAGNCRTDADCGGLGCSPTSSESCGNMGGTVGYYCHTRKDDCVNDDECTKGTEHGMCVYSPAGGRWTCNYSMCVG